MTEAVTQFFTDVLADEGYYCLAQPKESYYNHQVVDSIDKLAQIAKTSSDSGHDTFFCVATLAEPKRWNEEKNRSETRSHANVSHIKSLFLDLDCGQGKPFADQSVALSQLKLFLANINFPKPTYINSSGKGIHVYWCFDQAVEGTYWKQIANKFKSITEHFKFPADPAITADMARVLRVPGTFNHKNKDNPLEVKILMRGEVYPLAMIEDLVDSIVDANKVQVKGNKPKADSHLLSLFGKSNLDIATDKKIELVYEKCPQMADCLEVGGPVGYNRRGDWASIIKHCEDPDYSILTKNDPSPDVVDAETDQMLATSILDNPHTCERFESNNPGGCDTCLYKGKVKSPISLGIKTVELTDPEAVERIAEVQAKAEEILEEKIEQAEFKATSVRVDGKTYKIYQPPKPYSFSADGKVMRHIINEGEVVNECITDFLIIPVELCTNKTSLGKDSLRIYLKVGVSDERIIELPMAIMGGADILRKTLAANSILSPHGEKSTTLFMFMNAYIKHLQSMMKPSELHGSLGWDSEDMNFFVTPNGRYMRDGTFLPSSTSDNISQAMAPLVSKGTLDDWKTAIDFYNKEGYEDYAFGHLVGYGSLLFGFSGHSGAVVSLVGDSGSGKTTILQSINSIFGKPNNLLTQADTINAKMNRLGVYKNYPVTYDEITNMDNDELSQFVYSVSQGRSKLRLEQTGNERASGNSYWQMIMVCTGNANLVDKLMSHKQDASPEVLRVFEYHVHRRDEVRHSVAREIFNRLSNNYGHAGDIFIEYMTKNVDEIHKLYDTILDKVETATQTMQKERFWVAIVTSTIVGGLIAKKLGLHNFDMNRIFDWSVNRIKDMCNVVSDSANSPTQILSGFLNAAYNRTITVAGGIADKSGKMTPLYVTFEPTGSEIWVRQERDRNLIFVDASRLREYLTKSQSGFGELKKVLTASGVLLNANANKTLSANSQKHQSGSVKCWTIDMSHKEMVGLLAPLEHKMTSTPVLDNFNTSDSAED